MAKNVSDKIWSVGADVGFASVKGVVLEYDKKKGKGMFKQKSLFPSRVVQGKSQIQSISGLGGKPNEPTSYRDEHTGIEYTVASNQRSESTRFDGYHTSSLNRVLTQHLMQKLKLPEIGVFATDVATGLPIDMYYIGTETNEDLKQEKINSLKKNAVIPLDGFKPVSYNNVTVIPEGLGAYLDYVIDENGVINENLSQDVIAVVDIGGRTTDIFVGFDLNIDFSRVKGQNIGVLDVLESMRLFLQQNYDIREESLQRIEEMLFTGKYRYRGTQLENDKVIACISYGIKNTLNRLQAFIQSVLGTQGNDLDKILVVGGGAAIFGKDLKNVYSSLIHIVDEPQYANSRGFAKYALNVQLY